MTLAEVNAAISALNVALGSGQRRVRFSDGREVEYQTAADIEERLRMLRAEAARLATGAAAPTFRLRSFPVAMRRD